MQLAHNKEWGFHNAKVNTVAWSPNSLLVASGSLDTTIIIWSVTNPAKHTIIKSKLRKIVNNMMTYNMRFSCSFRCASTVANYSPRVAGQQYCDLHWTGLQYQSLARGNYLRTAPNGYNNDKTAQASAYFYT